MSLSPSPAVMPGLVPGVHAFPALWLQDVDGRNLCRHDASVSHGGMR